MLTEERLRQAAQEAERFLLTTIPEEEEEPHEFSPRFQRKMAKLLRRVEHPIRYRVMRTAAAVLLAIMTLFGAVMAVSPDARAAVVRWVRSVFLEFSQYSSNATNANDDTDGNTTEPTVYEYCLSVIPDGYRELRAVDRLDGKTYMYVNDVGNILQFTYAHGAAEHSLFIEAENYECRSGMVNGLPADIYLPYSESETSVIVWCDTEADVIFQIFAYAEQTKLVEIAETVVKIEK